jgi:hypothetical protein
VLFGAWWAAQAEERGWRRQERRASYAAVIATAEKIDWDYSVTLRLALGDPELRRKATEVLLQRLSELGVQISNLDVIASDAGRAAAKELVERAVEVVAGWQEAYSSKEKWAYGHTKGWVERRDEFAAATERLTDCARNELRAPHPPAVRPQPSLMALAPSTPSPAAELLSNARRDISIVHPPPSGWDGRISLRGDPPMTRRGAQEGAQGEHLVRVVGPGSG